MNEVPLWMYPFFYVVGSVYHVRRCFRFWRKYDAGMVVKISTKQFREDLAALDGREATIVRSWRDEKGFWILAELGDGSLVTFPDGCFEGFPGV